MALSTPPAGGWPEAVRAIFDRHVGRITPDLLAFQAQPCSPTAAFDCERRLAERLRDLGRDLTECLYNHLEGAGGAGVPSRVRVAGEDYRRVGAKTRHAVDTVFGPIVLWRHLYRPAARDAAEPAIAPLAWAVGVVAGTTPALAEVAARAAAAAGASQRQVQDQLRERHGVAIGTKRLRAVLAHVSGAMAETRQAAQVERVLDLLGQATASVGRCKPVLSVSRDGISLREDRHGLFEVATAGTLTVTDRRGRRLGTVYLAFAPEAGQPQMTDHLTGLIAAVLRRWEGPLPRLAYVADAGDSETKYFHAVLRPMVHPRTGAPLTWQRVLDFYHAMERVWKLADVLFAGDTRGRWAWGRRMGKLLKTPNGPFRVLHAAAALRARQRLGPADAAAYRTAYNYLRSRTPWMQYAEYARVKLPLGSGIVEAACKTIYTQRLKLSGMRWGKAGAQVILNLRVVLLSGVWDRAYRQTLKAPMVTELRTPARERDVPLQMAA
jgi:hypothetical protein